MRVHGHDRTNRSNTGGMLRESTEEPNAVPEAEMLLTQVDLHLKELLAGRMRFESGAKEDRIAYSLLRVQGYSDDSVECQRLVSRQRQLGAAGERLDAMISEARRLQRRLHDVLDASRAEPQSRLRVGSLPTFDNVFHATILATVATALGTRSPMNAGAAAPICL